MSLLQVHGAETGAARVEAPRTIGEPLEIPDVGKNACTAVRHEVARERETPLEVVETW